MKVEFADLAALVVVVVGIIALTILQALGAGIPGVLGFALSSAVGALFRGLVPGGGPAATPKQRLQC